MIKKIIKKNEKIIEMVLKSFLVIFCLFSFALFCLAITAIPVI